jgi:uncharacterized RDD family membrane protein YckC
MAERSAAQGLAAVGGEIADEAASAETAGLGARLLAYLLDTVVLFAMTMVFSTIAGLIILVSSDFGENDASDEAFLALVLVILACLPVWVLITMALFWWRGQSVGQYLMSIEITRDDGGVPSTGQIAAYTLLLHPLVFHPIVAALWMYVVYQSVILVESSILIVAAGVMATLCVLGPLTNLAFAAFDHRRRGVHDRLAGIRVVKVIYGE